MSVGNEMIDKDHKHLIGLINAIETKLREGLKGKDLTSPITQLSTFSAEHFYREEQYMRKIAFPNYWKHRTEHVSLISSLKYVFKSLMQWKGEQSYDNSTQELIDLLRKLILDHFLGDDLEIKNFLLNKTAGARELTNKVKEIMNKLNDILEKPLSKDGPLAEGLHDKKIMNLKKKLLKLLKTEGNGHIVLLSLGQFTFRTHNYPESEQWLRKTLSINFSVPEAHHLLSVVLRKLGKTPESIKELEIAMTLNPASGEIKQKLGEAYLREGLTDKAIQSFAEAIPLFEARGDTGAMARSKNKLGQTKVEKGEETNNVSIIEEAIEDITEATRLDPGMVSAHYNLMVAFQKTGATERAREVLAKIQSMEPKDAEGWIAFGKTFLEQEERGKARFAFKKADGLGGQRYEMLEEISMLLYQDQMYDDALGYLDKAQKANPSEVFSYNLKGIIYRRLAEYASSVREYENAVELDPENAGLHFNLGVALLDFGMQSESLENFKKVKQLDADFSEVDQYLTGR